MHVFTERVLEILRMIPEGRVATYGQIARLAGNARGARQVARILHSMSEKHRLPWHRVVNAKGEVVIGDPETAAEQKNLLLGEGVEFLNDRKVDLPHYQWQPTEYHWEWMEG